MTRTPERTAAMWREYDIAAEWCAKRGLLGVPGDPLPDLLGDDTCQAIADDDDAFARRVKNFAYALAMEETHRKHA